MTKVDWNYDEFLTFLLIYVSHVDIDFSEEEKAHIKENASEETFDKMLPLFNDMSDYKALETIMNYKGLYYPTHARKEELLSKIKELFYSDGDFSIMEKELYHFLEKLM